MTGLVRFDWSEAPDAIGRALADWTGPAPVTATGGRAYAAVDPASGRRLEIRIPLVLSLPVEGETIGCWLDRCVEPPGRQALLLLQAGAAALGRFEEGELVAHRTLRRYVVRGRGRAQPAYLKTKGKSRAGSRLRLRNARRLLEEVVTTWEEWEHEHGPPDRVFHSCPVRAWAELRRAGLSLDESSESVKVPLDLNRPGHEEMLRAWTALTHGSWLTSEPAPGGESEAELNDA